MVALCKGWQDKLHFGCLEKSSASQEARWASCVAPFTSCGAALQWSNASFLTSFLPASIHYGITLLGEYIRAGRPSRESITDSTPPVISAPGRAKVFSRATATAKPNSAEIHTPHIFFFFCGSWGVGGSELLL